ncbi:hypothetical protein B0T11DRAFT_321490 [Plectosphaerella cucumerina]|uniref:Glycosyltransferase family 34 protein n=1 Tax=Plectosphaerella cucumerina TaxID=40658 RepID=A0A8K0X0H7_9PEZI|nr:hypothetical protein B0T11DRAFT_321490 [Plectosphaerella cucumerina]
MMILRNHSKRLPLLTIVALAFTTSLFGLWYAYNLNVSVATPQSWGSAPAPAAGEAAVPEEKPPAVAAPDPDDEDQIKNFETPDEVKDFDAIAKVTVAVNKLDNELIHRSLKTHERQNELHGYQHFIASEQAVSDLIENDSRHRPKGAWTKPAYLLSLIVAELQKPEEERLEWLFWFDADTLVMNPHTPLEAFLPPADDPELKPMHLFMASNWDGLNSGAFALRVHPWSASLMSAVLAYPIFMSKKMETDRFRDQSAFQWLLQNDTSPITQSFSQGREHWAVTPMRWYNALPVNNAFDRNKPGLGWLFGHKMEGKLFDNGTTDVFDDGTDFKIQPWKIMRGDMIVHFAGTTAGGTRDSWMGPWLDRAEAELPEWADPSTADKLRDETAKFWKETSKRVHDERLIAEKKQAEFDEAEKKRKEEEDKKKKEEEERRKKEEEDKKKKEEAGGP